MSMKSLLWKEYRQNRRMLIGVGIFLLLPYFLACLFRVIEGMATDVAENWLDYLLAASFGGLFVSAGIGAFVAGNAMAGERADRSAEFAAYLPVSRSSAVLSKAFLAIGACVIVWLVNLLVLLVTRSLFEPRGGRTLEFVWVVALAGVLIFGVSWLFSSLLASPSNAMALGVGAWVLLIGTLAFIDHTRGQEDFSGASEFAYFASCLIIGVGCFVAGVVYYLRRVEP